MIYQSGSILLGLVMTVHLSFIRLIYLFNHLQNAKEKQRINKQTKRCHTPRFAFFEFEKSTLRLRNTRCLYLMFPTAERSNVCAVCVCATAKFIAIWCLKLELKFILYEIIMLISTLNQCHYRGAHQINMYRKFLLYFVRF